MIQVEAYNDTLQVKAGIKPDSPFYFLDRGWEKFRLWITVNEEKEMKLLLKYSEERLAELNELNDDLLIKHADSLYEAYGINIEVINHQLSKWVIIGEMEESKLIIFKEQLNHIIEVDSSIEQSKINHISQEVKSKINDFKTTSCALVIVSHVDKQALHKLNDQGFGYGDMIKMMAIMDLSGKSIEELMYLDIYTEEKQKSIEMSQLANELDMDMHELHHQFQEYKNVVKKISEEENEERKQDQISLRNELRVAFRNRMGLLIEHQKHQLLSKIEEIYHAKINIIENLTISETMKSDLINELNDAKENLIKEIQNLVEKEKLNPRDLAEINRIINQVFNEIINNSDLDKESRDQIRRQMGLRGQ